MSKAQTKQPAAGRRLLRSTTVVGAMTLLSRVLGLVRDVVFARFFGAGIVMDAFFVAFKIPNIFRRFFAEGAFSQAFVPVFTEYDERQSRPEVQELVDRVAGTLGIALFGVTLAGVLAAPLLIAVFAPGFIAGAEAGGDRYGLAVAMLRLTFPYLLFISLAALAGGILNTYQRFAAPAFAPVLLNLCLILFAAGIAPRTADPGIALAAGVFVAGALQLLFMLPFLARLKILPRPRWGWRHPGVRRVLGLMAPVIFGASVAQVNILFDTLIASFLATGSISWLYYSDRLMEFPLGVFGIALATVILPNLSRQHAAQSADEFSATLDWAVRLVALIAVPATVGLAVLAGPLLATIFYGGRFGAGDVAMARISLVAYALGLSGFILVKVLAPGFFARQDTRTPVRIGVLALLVNMGLNLLLVLPWLHFGLPGPHAGLACATSLAAFLNAGLLWRGLVRDGAWRRTPGWGRFLAQVLVAAGLMGGVLVWLLPDTPAWLAAGLLERCAWLAAAVAGGAALYALALLLAGVRPGQLLLRRRQAPL
ncbi:MAG: murein biosynthesis integral membrane protein MurJ [Gammaproteobacteria bacterium]|nr:MAG: murein biosynthesis integral membrane protein MurJ [Gammaproteobacteria bacterium]